MCDKFVLKESSVCLVYQVGVKCGSNVSSVSSVCQVCEVCNKCVSCVSR